MRDYMRYKDVIQCAGHDLLQLVRAEARQIAPQYGGEFYALHIRRGDFQFKVCAPFVCVCACIGCVCVLSVLGCVGVCWSVCVLSALEYV